MTPIPAEIRTSEVPCTYCNPVSIAKDMVIGSPKRTEQGITVRMLLDRTGKKDRSISIKTDTLTTIPMSSQIDKMIPSNDIGDIISYLPLIQEFGVTPTYSPEKKALVVKISDTALIEIDTEAVTQYFKDKPHPFSLVFGKALLTLMALPRDEIAKAKGQGLLLCSAYDGNPCDHHILCLGILGAKLLEFGVDLGSPIVPDRIYAFCSYDLSYMLTQKIITQEQLNKLNPVGVRAFYK